MTCQIFEAANPTMRMSMKRKRRGRSNLIKIFLGPRTTLRKANARRHPNSKSQAKKRVMMNKRTHIRRSILRRKRFKIK